VRAESVARIVERADGQGDGVGETAALDRVRARAERGLEALIALQVGGDARTDATLTYNAPRSVWNVTLYVNNLADKNAVANVFPNDIYPIFSAVPATLRPPRTFGVRGQVNF